MLFVFSDLHGNAAAARAIQARIDALQPERIAFLGDALWPGRSLEAVDLLDGLGDRLTAVAGNCDSETTSMQLRVPLLPDYALLNLPPHRLFLTHGDRWNPHRQPPAGLGDLLLYGHTHLPDASRLASGLVAFNPGSAGQPRGGYPPSYGTFDGQRLAVHDLGTGAVLLDFTFDTIPSHP